LLLHVHFLGELLFEHLEVLTLLLEILFDSLCLAIVRLLTLVGMIELRAAGSAGG